MRKHQSVLVGGGRGLICHCHIANLVDGIELAMTHDDAPGGIFIIHDGSSSTLAAGMAALAGKDAESRSP